ncbi:response regulator [Nitrospira sp. M1]
MHLIADDQNKIPPCAKRILIVERETSDATWLSEFLASKGYNVLITVHQEEVSKILQTQVVDGIFLNLDDTSMRGLDMMKNIRSNFSMIPVIITFSEPGGPKVREAFAEGVKGCVSKPVSFEQLQEALFIFERHLVSR